VTNGQAPFVQHYTFRIDPATNSHVLTTTNSHKDIPGNPVKKINMEDKSQDQSNPATTNKTTGSPRANSPGSNKPAAARQLEDIWKKEPSSGSPERRRNGIYSSQFNELC